MVEKTPILDFFTYLLLIAGIAIVGFPIIYVIMASSSPLEEVSKVPMPVKFGDQFLVNMSVAWERGNLGN